MWLLTQNKTSLVNLNNFDSIDAVGRMVTASKAGVPEEIVLGRYMTDREAEETLEDLAKFIEDSQEIPFADNSVVYITK